MRAVVVYESMYGSTHKVADAIRAGLQGAFEVTVVPLGEATAAVLADAGLVVVGGPTHVHGMSRAGTRKTAAQTAAKRASGVQLEPGADAPGLREWFGSLGRYHVRAAAFDTRMQGPAALTGRASTRVARLLRDHGFTMAAKPESFLVTRQEELAEGETGRAREWAAKLAGAVAPV